VIKRDLGAARKQFIKILVSYLVAYRQNVRICATDCVAIKRNCWPTDINRN